MDFIYIVSNGEVKKHYIKEKKSKTEILFYLFGALFVSAFITLFIALSPKTQTNNQVNQQEKDNQIWYHIQYLFPPFNNGIPGINY